MSRERFQAQLSASLDAGFSFVPAERIARGLGSANELAVTFDDGRRSVADFAAPILTELEIPATLFVVSNWADGKHPFPTGTMLGWRDIEQLVATGFAVGSHSVTHRNFRELSPDEATFELFESRRMIEQRIGITPRAFAIPFGRSQDWTAAAGTAAREAGYDTIYAASVSLRPEGTVARTTITRFDGDRVFRALLNGAFDRWEEWIL